MEKKINLENMGVSDVLTWRWDWSNDQFSYAIKSHDEFDFQNDYREEMFSASNIQLSLAPEDKAMTEDEPIPAPSLSIAPPTVVVGTKAKGGRPPKYDWEQACAALVFKWADEGAWEPASQAEVARALGDWFSERGDPPVES